MRKLWMKCAYILILQFVLLPSALSNTLTVDEARNVHAETDRYVARFENGVLSSFHNKLTQETYTHGEFEAHTELVADGRNLKVREITPEIKGLSPLECQLIYQDAWAVPRKNEVMLHLFISIDAGTGDLLIRQAGFSETGGIERIMWGFSNVSHETVEVIAPVFGGQILRKPNRYHYPSKWEAQFVILQGKRGGVFVRNDDTRYQFKTLEYLSDEDSFAINFWQIPQAPFEQRNQITTTTWRLNAYQGNWQVPTILYREWMHEALQPVDRTEMPAWVNDIECVIIHVNVKPDMIRLLNQIVDAEKTLLYLIGWRASGWSRNFPDYTPAKGFGDFVREAQRYGFRVMPHVNMIGVSTSNPLYAKFGKYQMYDPRNGEKIELIPQSGQPYALINPASRSFRKMLVNELKSVWETYEVDAFHLDLSYTVVNNAPIDALTIAEGNILLHQELREAMPGIALSGELLNEVTFLYENLAQRDKLPPTEQAHPISTLLFSPYVRSYGHLRVPNPERKPEVFQDFLEEYAVWDTIPTIRLWDASDLEPDRSETHKFFEIVRQRQNWTFGDVNSDGVVNILDLTLVAQQIGTLNPSNQRVDVNKDGVINILDLTLVAQEIG